MFGEFLSKIFKLADHMHSMWMNGASKNRAVFVETYSQNCIFGRAYEIKPNLT